ncbi:hypothetical protein BDV96DRAFT_644434 [Lophiotrema nucula]|uniref:Protein kinase domain-containing protein n=1 Tax=Lophiotrema nucula TaxID=690887 RepID=A0A6A5ZD78_9PLEO|nr:hypothetical protein BDV96DRAFT_644434 [Lophiotrema nucula]
MSDTLPNLLQTRGYIVVKKIFPRPGKDLNAKNAVYLALRYQGSLNGDPNTLLYLENKQYSDIAKHLRVIKVAGPTLNDRAPMFKELNIYTHNWKNRTPTALREHLLEVYTEDSNVKNKGQCWMVMDTPYPSMSLSDLVTYAKSTHEPIPEPLIAHIVLELIQTLIDLDTNWRVPVPQNEQAEHRGCAHGDLHYKNILLSASQRDNSVVFPSLRIIDFARATGKSNLKRKERTDALTRILEKLMGSNTACGTRKHVGGKECKHSEEWIAFWDDLYTWNRQVDVPEWRPMLAKHKDMLEKVRNNVPTQDEEKIRGLLTQALERSGMLISDEKWEAALVEVGRVAEGIAGRAAEALAG